MMIGIAIVLAWTTGPSLVAAQGALWPERPIRLIVPFHFPAAAPAWRRASSPTR